MKIYVTFKTPDTVKDAVEEQAKRMVSEWESLKPEDREMEEEGLVDETMAKLAKWVKYGECVTVEFDTVKGTATVQEV